ncbi:MAG: MtaA/CmuA family methyltransferase [Candidatus Methanomethylophilaceae archaeon]|nr:MtaA/CmuA family methyltransferase [Candidatus Methanomethylophilaceae archaeon]
MTPRERVLAAMNKEKLDRPAVAVFTQSATVGQMEKCGASWPEAHKKPELMAKLAAAQADCFGYEAVRASFCLTAEAERLGCKVQADKVDAAPMIKNHPFHFDPMTGEYDTPAIMDPKEFVKDGRPKVVQDAVAILKKTHGKDYAIVAGNTGPFTLAGHMISTENMVFGMMMAPEEVDKWVDAVTPIVKCYTQALLDAGADFVQCSEPSSSTDMLAPDMFEEASGKAVRNSLGKVKGKTVLHICGDTYAILEQMVSTNVTGLSIEEKVDPDKAMEKMRGKIAMVGNVGSVKPLFQGTPAEVKAAATHSAKAGFNVISSGCGIASRTPDANMQAMVEAIKAFKY